MMGKGLACAAVGAVIGAVVWVILIHVTGLNLWILAPIVGGCAGFGMMRGTQKRGGAHAGVLAGAVTLSAIFAARYAIVRVEVRDELAVDDAAIISQLVHEVADEWSRQGYEVYNVGQGDYTRAVYHEAEQRWIDMSAARERKYAARLAGGKDDAATALTPGAMAADFGIFGTFWAFLAVACAFKTGSATLEPEFVEQGYVADADDAHQISERLLNNNPGIFNVLGDTQQDRPNPTAHA